ncbi:VWA domain-containing protein [Brumimicrobium glaciale]|uniref:VWA domain-containing protein n=1 Tax=Brumimicrobium glaciale TaxID=200475 RepID=A0A4Q4KNL0_9FLAO|nr:vWA domain-containing protein [Brumimicrobium glaciale]RYM34600.1 VWA domain-containing protein [Brumimicrobium glaciale]
MTELFSDIPMWTLLPWAVVAVALSLLLYRKKSWVKEISNFKRFLLISLRSLGLFLLGVLLLGILIKGMDSEIDQPLIITIVDDSESMLNYSDSAEVKNQTKAFLNTANSSFNSDYNHSIFTLYNDLESVDSLVFNNSETNLSNVLNKAYDNYYGRNIGAIVLLSDGNFNAGSTPLLVAEKFKKTPVYTLSVGDTIQKVDHLVKGIVANEIAFLDNKFPVEISIEGNKTPSTSFELQLKEDGKVIASKSLKHQESEYSLVKADFLLDAKSIGVHEYTVTISSIANEFNLDNNEKTFYVEVLDDRSNVLIIAEALNPDVGAIKSALITENNLEVKTVTANELPTDYSPFDLIIWHNPGVSKNQKAFDQITAEQIPAWYIITTQTSRLDIGKLQLSANINTTGSADNFGAAYNQGFSLFKLSPETRKMMDNFPPLNAHYGNVNYANTASILAFQRLGAIKKSDPLFFFGGKQDKKFAVTYGSGLWSWRLADYQTNQNQEHFNEIVHKTVQYLILKENTSRLRIQLPSLVSSTEDLIIKASFYNESYEAITDPTIDLELSKPNGEKFEYSFLPLDKEYSLDLGQLSAGRYSWKASTTYNGSTFAKEGTFGVKDLALEKQTTKANHQLLKQMAENGQGKFAMLADYQAILDDINQREDIVPVAYESSTYHKLIDYVWLMLVIVALFTTEWVIRRYSGAY